MPSRGCWRSAAEKSRWLDDRHHRRAMRADGAGVRSRRSAVATNLDVLGGRSSLTTVDTASAAQRFFLAEAVDAHQVLGIGAGLRVGDRLNVGHDALCALLFEECRASSGLSESAGCED